MENVIDNDTALTHVATNVRDILESRAISQRELARRTGDPVMTLNNLLSERSMPSGAILARVAEALGVKIDDLFQPPRKKSKKPA